MNLFGSTKCILNSKNGITALRNLHETIFSFKNNWGIKLNLTVESKAGTVKAGRMREYCKNPASLNLAASAAAYTANKLGERVVVVEGNSYGNKVYHIAQQSEPLSKYTAMSCTAKVLIVEPSGECFYGIAE
jgi:hypothetical protein